MLCIIVDVDYICIRFIDCWNFVIIGVGYIGLEVVVVVKVLGKDVCVLEV